MTQKLKRGGEEREYTNIYSGLVLSSSHAPTRVFNGLKLLGNNQVMHYFQELIYKYFDTKNIAPCRKRLARDVEARGRGQEHPGVRLNNVMTQSEAPGCALGKVPQQRGRDYALVSCSDSASTTMING